MSDIPPAAAAAEVRFGDMTLKGKLVFAGKALVFFLSGGFVYPTLWVD